MERRHKKTLLAKSPRKVGRTKPAAAGSVRAAAMHAMASQSPSSMPEQLDEGHSRHVDAGPSTTPSQRDSQTTRPKRSGKSAEAIDDDANNANGNKRRLVYVLGHSFIRRLHRYVLSESGHRSFRLNDFDIIMKGFSGANISRLRQYTATGRQIGLTGSSVILQIGVSDLNSPYVQPVALAREIITFARELVNERGVASITICQLLHRRQSLLSRHILRLNYNILVDEVNRELSFLCTFFPKMTFLEHKRMKDNWEDLLDADGTHLNRDGIKKYFRSIRGAIMHVK